MFKICMASFQHHARKRYTNKYYKNYVKAMSMETKCKCKCKLCKLCKWKIWRFYGARNWSPCHVAKICSPFTIVLKSDILHDKWINLKILCNLCGVVLNPASVSFPFLLRNASSELKQLKQFFWTKFFILFLPSHFPALLLFPMPARNSTFM